MLTIFSLLFYLILDFIKNDMLYELLEKLNLQ